MNSFFERRLYYIFLISLSLFLLSHGLHSQNGLDPDKNLDQYIYDQWSGEDGLPVNSVIYIIQAKNGYIWFVSYGGITRFNGIEFFTYSSFNTPEIENNSFTHIYEDNSGIIWASSSGGGITAIDGNKIKTYTTADGLPVNFIEEVVQDNNGRLWVATSNGLYYKEGNQFVNDDTPEALKASKLRSITNYKNELYVGTGENGVYHVSNSKVKAHYSKKEGLASNKINFVEVKDDVLWVGTDEGLSIIDGDKIKNITRNDGLQNNNITSSAIDDKGVVWIGSYRGFARIINNKFSYFPESHPLYEQDITSLLLDSEGNLWLGTYRNGLYKMWDGKFTNYSIPSKDQEPYVVHAILKKEIEDEYFVVHQKGVSLLNTKLNDLKPLPLDENITDTNLKSGYYDSKGNLWICTLNSLIKHKNGRSQVLTTKDGLVHDNVRIVFEDSKGNIWVGTTNGISVLGDGRVKNYNEANGLSHEYIMSIWEDADGKIWIGTRNGLNLFENDKFTHFYARDGLAGDFIFRTFEDSDGVMWICGNAGLTRYSDGKFEKILAKHGLISNTIFQILEDDKGYFWFTTNQKGVSVFKVLKSELNDFLDGKISHVNSHAYSQEDGLKASAATSSAQSIKATDGSLLFATNRGVEKINPSKIKLNLHKPPIVIEDLLVEDNPIDSEGIISIPAGKSRVTINFAALSYTAPKSITYKYKLSGFDDRWRTSANDKTISYTNLPYGDYEFQVLASNRDGIWNEEGAKLAFYVKPAFYETKTFSVLMILLIAMLGATVYNLRLKSLKKSRRELERIVAERTNEILQQKEEIETQKEAIVVQQQQIEEKNEQLLKVNLSLEDIVKERTNQLRKTYRELLKVNKELDTFIYRSVHDVRGPIARLQGLSNLISMETQDPQILDLVSKLNCTADEMNDVFYRLLNIVRLRASELNIQKIDIKKIINEVLKNLSEDHSEHKMEVDIAPDFELFSDKETIENIFYQVIDNAIKFKKEDRAYIKIACSKKSEKLVLIRITDDGVGIPKELEDKIFDMFFVGHDKLRGTGLGLYTVKTAVRVLNGKIRLNQEKGKTTFEIMLPANIS